MKKLSCVTAALVALFAIGAESPANAAMGQCFDAYGRPVGPPHSTDNPPYSLICSVFAQGGQCTGVDPAWAASNCGWSPSYYDKGYQYRDDPRYKPYYRLYYNRGGTVREREIRRLKRIDPNMKFIPQTDPNSPPIPDRGQPNNAR